MFKRNDDGDVITSTKDEGGEEYYYNDAIPWEGALIEYVQEIVQVSCAISYSHSSRNSSSNIPFICANGNLLISSREAI